MTVSKPTPVRTLGILGGGQLGRMSALAAARLGIVTHIYTPEEDSPASQVAARTFVGAWDDESALEDFARSVDVVSYEFENIPIETVRFVGKIVPIHPGETLLSIAQDRLAEKKFLNDIGIPTALWAGVSSPEDALKTADALSLNQFILKTTRFGYDGKGQAFCHTPEESKVKWAKLNSHDIILEQVIDFECEISVLAARDQTGAIALYGPILNNHKNHILDTSQCPAPIAPDIAEDARQLTHRLAEAVDLVGVLALELFVTRDGRILANEIAPRTHNSGHWTIDACAVSQFEQHVRTVCGLPVGNPAQHSAALMTNLIGDDVADLSAYYNAPHTSVHLYGKHEARPGRKMGHVTVLQPEAAQE